MDVSSSQNLEHGTVPTLFTGRLQALGVGVGFAWLVGYIV